MANQRSGEDRGSPLKVRKGKRQDKCDAGNGSSPCAAAKQRKGEEREQAKEPEEDKPPMAAPKGNRFWEARSSHGRKPIFPNPEALWNAACEYFHWNEENPLIEGKICSYQGVNTIEQLPKMRAMSTTALCIFLDIDFTTWKDYQSKEDFSQVTTRIEEIIYHQKFTGASADLLNANIIARDLGLREKADLALSGTVELKQLPDEHINDRLAALQAKLIN